MRKGEWESVNRGCRPPKGFINPVRVTRYAERPRMTGKELLMGWILGFASAGVLVGAWLIAAWPYPIIPGPIAEDQVVLGAILISLSGFLCLSMLEQIVKVRREAQP